MLNFLSKVDPTTLKGTALVRIDVNTEETTRMEAVLPTFEFLKEHAQKIVILSHAGRPLDTNPRLSLEGKAELFAGLLKKEVRFIPHFEFEKIREEIHGAPNGTIFFLENLRFLREEADNDEGLARSLASLGDYYVNDAFPVSHRKAASIVGITKFIPHYAGLRFEAELETLAPLMESPEHPLVFILGGAKAADKIGVLENFEELADWFLLAGTPANTALDIQGIDVMQSLKETDAHSVRIVNRLLKSKKVVLPIDWKWGDQRILDIGPQTTAEFKEKIATAKTIIWNGPVGLFEQSGFESGTKALVEALANCEAKVIVGGGETLTAWHTFSSNLESKTSNVFISTGGGAMLEFLSGKKLPGIIALEQ